MYYFTFKYKILFILFDIFSILLGLNLLQNTTFYEYNFVKNIYIQILIVLLTLLINIFTEEYRYIELRGYIKELKYSVLYSIKIVIIISFVLILNKEYYFDDLMNINFKFMFELFLIFAILSYSLRITCKYLIKPLKEKKKKTLYFLFL